MARLHERALHLYSRQNDCSVTNTHTHSHGVMIFFSIVVVVIGSVCAGGGGSCRLKNDK